MIAVMALDFVNTLIGQPASFWVDPKTCHEGNQFVRLFLSHGWWAFALMDLGYFVGAFRLVSALGGRSGLICVFSFIFIHFVGASNWFFYEWRLGIKGAGHIGRAAQHRRGLGCVSASPRNERGTLRARTRWANFVRDLVDNC